MENKWNHSELLCWRRRRRRKENPTSILFRAFSIFMVSAYAILFFYPLLLLMLLFYLHFAFEHWMHVNFFHSFHILFSFIHFIPPLFLSSATFWRQQQLKINAIEPISFCFISFHSTFFFTLYLFQMNNIFFSKLHLWVKSETFFFFFSQYFFLSVKHPYSTHFDCFEIHIIGCEFFLYHHHGISFMTLQKQNHVYIALYRQQADFVSQWSSKKKNCNQWNLLYGFQRFKRTRKNTLKLETITWKILYWKITVNSLKIKKTRSNRRGYIRMSE